MLYVRIFSIMLLLTAVLALHVTTPKRHIAFIPAIEDGVKVRSAGLVTATEVVSLEEAERRYNERHGHALPDPYADYDEGCFLDSCSLELDLKLAKFHIVEFFSS